MTVNGSTDIQDVQQKFDELQYWEKAKFIENNSKCIDLDTAIDVITNEAYLSDIIIKRIFNLLTPGDILQVFDSDEMLDEIGYYTVFSWIKKDIDPDDLEELAIIYSNHANSKGLNYLEKILKNVQEKIEERRKKLSSQNK